MSQTSNAKIKEMRKMIKGLTSNLEKLEKKEKNIVRTPQGGGNRTPNKYRIPFHPHQTLLRERINNDDQIIQPPLKNNLVDDIKKVDGLEENEMHVVEEHIHPTHLTLSDYEDALAIHQDFEEVHHSFAQNDSYQIYQAEA